MTTCSIGGYTATQLGSLGVGFPLDGSGNVVIYMKKKSVTLTQPQLTKFIRLLEQQKVRAKRRNRRK